MTDKKNKEMIKQAQEYIKSLKQSEIKDYILKILKGYEIFEEYCSQFESFNYLEADNRLTIKFKDLRVFDFIKKSILYPWPNIINIH